MLIDGNKLMLWLNDSWYSSFKHEESPTSIAIKEVMNAIEDNFDELAIVTCKDCRFKSLYDDGDTKYYYCALEDRPNRNWSVDDTDYCKWAEREENEHRRHRLL